MPSSYPTLKTFEEFLAMMAKEDDITKRRLWHQIEFAQKEMERLRAKAKKQYYKKKEAKKQAQEAIAEEEASS
jgi:hypothetical protein